MISSASTRRDQRNDIVFKLTALSRIIPRLTAKYFEKLFGVSRANDELHAVLDKLASQLAFDVI